MPRLRLTLAFLLALPAAAAVAVWLIGRTLTDSGPLTQYLFWVPAVLLLPAATLLGFAGWVVHRLGPPRRALRSRAERRRGRALAALAILCLASLTWQSLVSWRVYRAVLPRPRLDQAHSLTVFHWNMSAQSPSSWEANLARLPDDPPPDVFLLTNVHQGTRFRELRDRTGMNTAQWRHLAVASRFPVLRSAGASLGLPRPEDYPTNGGDGEEHSEPNPNPRAPGWYDPGQILIAEIDTTEVLGRPIAVWIIDLPSDPSIPRRDVAALVLDRLSELDRQWRTSTTGGFDGVPDPDLIAGDFNMTRGSAALRRITGGLPHAYDEAGWGFVATYPASRPLWHIDHIFVRHPLRAASYKVMDLGGSPHLAQRAVIVPAR